MCVYQLGVCLASRACTIFMSLTAFLALIATAVAFAIDMALWVIIRNRVRDRGYEAELVSTKRSVFAETGNADGSMGTEYFQGNANWLTVGALAALILGTCTAACGSCGRFATGRMAGEKYY